MTQPEEIPRVDRISRERFEREYLFPLKPVVVRGALDGWPAFGKWSHEFFKERYASARVNVLRMPEQGEAEPVIEPSTMAEYLGSFEAAAWPNPRRPPYVEFHQFLLSHAELEQDLGELEFYRNWIDPLPRAITRFMYDWTNLLISPRGAVYNLHADGLGVHACVLQFEGRKRFVLYPPDQAENLYEGRVDPDAPDLARFPKFAEARGRMEALLDPGDTVFVPCRWWHQVTTLDNSVSVVQHGVNAVNWASFLGNMLVRMPVDLARELTRRGRSRASGS